MLNFANWQFFEVSDASGIMPTWAAEVFCDHPIPYAYYLTSWNVITTSEIGDAGSEQC